MCLDKFDDTLKEYENYRLGVGYKVVHNFSCFRDYRSLFFPEVKLPVEEWLTAAPKIEKMHTNYTGGFYYPGFHIYLEDNFEIPTLLGHRITVKFRDPVCTGWDAGLPVVVAKQLFIPKDWVDTKYDR